MWYAAKAGPGVPLVFLHGSECDSVDWDATLRSLPSGIAHVCTDFRGHGKSDGPEETFTVEDLADDVLTLIEHLDQRHVVLVGHSLGGMVAVRVAARSDRVAGLVLLEGWTTLRASQEAFGGERFHGSLDQAAIDRILQKIADTRKRLPPSGREVLRESLLAFDAEPYLRAARIPILEVYGEMGRTDETFGRLGIPENPVIRTVWIPDSGHYLPHERPEEVARVCAEAASWPAPGG
jgi:pimeloyl-ACP methyl ester carboxylesterase